MTTEASGVINTDTLPMAGDRDGAWRIMRQEMHIVYEEWHKRIPDYRITPGTTPRVHWPRGTTGLESLHLTFDRKADR